MKDAFPLIYPFLLCLDFFVFTFLCLLFEVCCCHCVFEGYLFSLFSILVLVSLYLICLISRLMFSYIVLVIHENVELRVLLVVQQPVNKKRGMSVQRL